MQEHDKNGRRAVKIPSLIAWISVVLLAAAWGRSLDARLQNLWAQLGAFGLAAAVGLEAQHRIRHNRAAAMRLNALRARMELGLSRLNDENAALDSINVAVRRLTEHVLNGRQLAVSTSGVSKRHWEAGLLSEYPLELTSVDNSSDTGKPDLAPSVRGVIRQISSTAVSFDHVQPLNSRIVLATFNLKKPERLSFVVDVIWTEKTASGFVSGGTMLAVGVPVERDAEVC